MQKNTRDWVLVQIRPTASNRWHLMSWETLTSQSQRMMGLIVSISVQTLQLSNLTKLTKRTTPAVPFWVLQYQLKIKHLSQVISFWLMRLTRVSSPIKVLSVWSTLSSYHALRVNNKERICLTVQNHQKRCFSPIKKRRSFNNRHLTSNNFKSKINRPKSRNSLKRTWLIFVSKLLLSWNWLVSHLNLISVSNM